MKTKTFMFKVSACKSIRESNQFGDAVMVEQLDIDAELNNFIDNEVNQLIDIKITAFTSNRHNNGGSDEVWALYTIMYK